MSDRCNVLIHFENPEGMHEISAETLVIFIDAYKGIAKQFGLEVDLNLTIPEEGGWKAGLVVWTISFIGINPLLILFTDKSGEDWAKKARSEIVTLINQYITKKADEIQPPLPRECLEQKNKIYHQLQKDECVTGFKLGGSPAIPKKDFHLYIAELPDEKPIYLGITEISVFSPDWHGKRSWRGSIEILSDQEKSFDFEPDLTDKFWDCVRGDKLTLHTTDVMQVQLIEWPIRKVKHRVVRVLRYNEIQVDDPLPEGVISSMWRLSEDEISKQTPAQKALFEEFNPEN